jgi:hypothetical protein
MAGSITLLGWRVLTIMRINGRVRLEVQSKGTSYSSFLIAKDSECCSPLLSLSRFRVRNLNLRHWQTSAHGLVPLPPQVRFTMEFLLSTTTSEAGTAQSGGWNPETDPTGCTGFTSLGTGIPCARHFAKSLGAPSEGAQFEGKLRRIVFAPNNDCRLKQFHRCSAPFKCGVAKSRDCCQRSSAIPTPARLNI